ncbi:NAD-dependent epimerase/dehydratase family protein [Gephyromycinifex aptenodytis]|uniref:NAD-dependent epimerase/dehydratase family protein n=1 Tax=Gephyromycinifex aptenodytis TaxID=2716227 RepID=UPI0014454275|nr:NAD-dependent epimerase/dehydratase family protein [Gephyromycinifex aptenodytis]
MGSTILVTGVSRYIGARTARELAASPHVDRVIGIDAIAPEFNLGEAEFVRADVRNPIVGRVLAQSEADIVVHLSLSTGGQSRTAQVSRKEANVMGTMQLLAMCQAQRSVRHVVLKSTGSVYPAGHNAPAIYTENAAVNARVGSGFVRDAIDVESYVRALPRRRSDVGISVLRFTHILGAHVKTVMADYLNSAVVPVPFGFDARMQFLHEDDAVGALVAAASGEPVGTVNVAADGVLTLSQVLRLGRRPYAPVFTQTGRLLGAISRWSGVSNLSGEHIDYLMYGRCLDTTRMKQTLHYHPRYSTRETVQLYARDVWGIHPSPSRVIPGTQLTATAATCALEAGPTEKTSPKDERAVS